MQSIAGAHRHRERSSRLTLPGKSDRDECTHLTLVTCAVLSEHQKRVRRQSLSSIFEWSTTTAIVEVENFRYAVEQAAQTSLRSVLGEVELDDLLAQREKLDARLQTLLDEHTEAWGIKVTQVQVKQVDRRRATWRSNYALPPSRRHESRT